MTPPGNIVLMSMLLATAGMGIPAMASMNAAVGVRLGAPFAAVATLASVLLLVSAVTSLLLERPSASALATVPRTYLLAGVLFFFYISAITIIAPRVGLGNAILFVLLGQILSAVLIDHFGLFGAQILPLNARRMAGLLIMLFGVYLARR